ncbi:MAG TPA: PAS domain-containing protein [Gemmatimonadales bacterium]|nr:PAS domain-containing protein [Gemmatimonadales bacterium]
MTVSRSPHSTSARSRRERLLPYGVAVLSVALAGLLIEALPLLTAVDARPALLVAVTISALYGGVGPSVLALLLAGSLSRDPGVLLAGAALVGVCAVFRRAPAGKEPVTEPLETVPASTLRFDGAESTGSGSTAFAAETSRPAPSFLEVTTEATWRFHHEKPLDITLPEDEQVEHLYLYSSLAECNDAFARMYGFRAAVDVIGTRLVVFCPPSKAENVAYLRSFIRSGYRLEDAESQEIDRYGNAKYFVNNLVGIFERGQLVGAWGTQRDVTEQKGNPATQEYLSRIHSTKSSSQ